jgi:predicted nucleotidyltransferase
MKMLSPEQTTEVIQRLVAALNPDQIYLFGSHAWGAPHEHSDVDLYVVVSAHELTQHKSEVKAHLALVKMPLSKDILVRTRDDLDLFRDVKGSLTRKIVTEGKLIYDRRTQPTHTAIAAQSTQ